MAEQPPLREGVPSTPRYRRSPNGRSFIACGQIRRNGRTEPLQGIGRTKDEAFDAYIENGELRKTQRRRAQVNNYTSDSQLQVVIDEWYRLQTEENPHGRDQATLDRYFSEVFHSDDLRVPDKVIKIEDLAELTIHQTTTPRLSEHIRVILEQGHKTKAKLHRQLLIEILDVPFKLGILATNPAEAIPGIDDTPASPHGLDIHQLDRLRDQLGRWAAGEAIPGTPAGRDCDRDQTILDIFEVGLALTIRPGEILGLVWEEPDRHDGIPGGIDLDATENDGTPAPYAWITGIAKPRKGKTITRQPHTKAGLNGARRMPIPLWALPTFRRLREAYLNADTPNPLNLVFPSRAGTVRYPHNVYRTWRQARGSEFSWVTLGTTRTTGAILILNKLGRKAAAAQLGLAHEKDTNRYASPPTGSPRGSGS
ncbi:integrase [Nocardia sp. GAS34]|uniref:hypothetical protein n=1 Tax=unclassified Nocardia TaxID=2637762 RepID=UPI003D19F0CC